MLASITRRLPWLIALVLLLKLQPTPAHGQAATWQWATSPGTPAVGKSIGVDAMGNTYVTGSFTGSATFGTSILTSSGDTDAFVAKVASNGTYQWVVQAGGTGAEEGDGLTLDSSGNVYVTGFFFSPTVSFGATTLSSPGMFVAKLSSAGAWQWATRADGSSYDLTVDRNANLYVTGLYYGPAASFGSTTLTSNGDADIFVAKLNGSGVWQYAVGAGSVADDVGYGLAADSSGNVYVTGRFASQITFGTGVLNSAGATDMFVAKLTPAGLWQWATRAGGTDIDHGSAIVLDHRGSVYVCGKYYSPTAFFGTILLTNAAINREDLFVSKLSTDGFWQWAVSAGGTRDDDSYALTLDHTGNICIAGDFSSPAISFGTSTLSTSGNGDILVAALNPSGIWQWAISAGGPEGEGASAIATDGNGNLSVTGSFISPTAVFGSNTIANNTLNFQASVFIARLSYPLGVAATTATPPFSLFPNPAHETVTLTGTPTVTLLDALGRVVRTVTTPTGTATLDLRGLAPGLYTVRAGKATRRLAVE